MADTVREKILQRLVAMLETMTVANGYSVDMGSSWFRARPTFPESERPAGSVWDRGAEQAGDAYGMNRILMPVDIELHGAVDGGNASVVGNVLLGDLVKLVTTYDSTLMSYADSVRYARGEIRFAEDGSDTVTVNVTVNVAYAFADGDPYTAA